MGRSGQFWCATLAASLWVATAWARPAVVNAPELAASVAKLTQKGFSGEIAASHDGEITFAFAAGFSDRVNGRPLRVGERWPYASVTKQVTALLIMRAVDEGRLRLDETLDETLPDFSGRTARQITIRQLLQHTSGLPNPSTGAQDGRAPPFYTRPLAPESNGADGHGFCAGQPAAAPGERFDYNNCDYIVLGAILERLSGRSFERQVNDDIARPLALHSWAIAPRRSPAARRIEGFDHGVIAAQQNERTYGAAGAYFGTAADLLTFDAALMEYRLLSERSTRTMWTGDPAIGYAALGAWSFPARLSGCSAPVELIERRGAIAGYQARNILAPALKKALVIFTNEASFDFGEIWRGDGPSFELASAAFCSEP